MDSSDPPAPNDYAVPEVADSALRLAQQLAERFDVDLAEARACFRRAEVCLGSAEIAACAASNAPLRCRPYRLAHNACSTLPADEAVRWLAAIDWRQLERRVEATEALFDARLLAQSAGELSGLLADFAEHLRCHRDYAVATGLLPIPFRASSWLDRQLGPLYPLRRTGSSASHAERFSGRRPEADPFEFLRTAPDPDAREQTCPYAEADWLLPMHPERGRWFEALRPRLFDAKLAVLTALADQLAQQPPQSAWPEARSALLAAFPDGELNAFLELDREFASALGAVPSDSPRPAGGVAALVQLLGFAEAELAVGLYAASREALTPKALDAARAALDERTLTPDRLYFALAFGDARRELDAAADAFAERRTRFATRRSQFEARAIAELQLRSDATLRIAVPAQHAEALAGAVQQFATRAAGRLAAGEWLDEPPFGLNLFRRDGASWSIAYRGKLLGMPHAVGFIYLRTLLELPNRSFEPGQLLAIRTAWERSPSGRSIASLATEGIAAASALPDEQIDATAQRDYRRRLDQLPAEIERARTDGALAHVDELEAERDQLARHLDRATRSGGKSRTLPTAKKREADAVRKAIDEAIARLEAAHPELHRHLDRHVERSAALCRYAPSEAIEWQF